MSQDIPEEISKGDRMPQKPEIDELSNSRKGVKNEIEGALSESELSENTAMEEIRSVVEQNAERIASLGKWPPYIKPESLLERIPESDEDIATGFDAGLACALNLIPRDAQELPATLHANYSKEAVMRVRKEMEEQDPNSGTIWWLAASKVCTKKSEAVNKSEFLEQIEEFRAIAPDESQRLAYANEMFEEMQGSFKIHEELGVPYGEKDGCIQGAYIDGYSYGVMFNEKYGLYFIGTYEPSLGLENFEWSDDKDEKGRAMSGPVFGSKQFVKCSSKEELKNVLEEIKKHLSLKD